MTGDNEPSEKVILGRITGVYGVKGWVKIFSYTEPMEAIVDYDPLFIRVGSSNSGRDSAAKGQAAWTKVTLKSGKRHAKTVVAQLENCDDRDAAMAYVGNEIAIELQQLKPLADKNEFYWRDLIGLTVINQQAITLGQVKNLMETGANDVLVVSESGGIGAGTDAETGTTTEQKSENRERLIPWTMGIAIINVDLEQGVITVDWDADF